MDRQRITTILTLLIVGLWIITAVVRLFIDWPQAAILDSAMAPVIGYWFLTNANAKKDSSDKTAAAT